MELKDLKTLHDKAYEHGQVTREQASDDLVFYYVTQWDDNLLSNSPLQYRGQFDVLRKAGRQIMSSLSANPVQVDFEPTAESRQDGADLIDGLYRSDDRVNSSVESYNIASNESVVCGVGAWMLYTEWESNQIGDFNQVIRRRPLYEANNKVFWDPNAKLQDKSDANYVSVLHTYSEDGYRELVEEMTGEDADNVSMNSFKTPEQSYVFPWYSENAAVYVTEFFYREKFKCKNLLMVSPMGEEMILREDDLEEIMDEMIDLGFEIVAEKEVERWQVTRYLASGAEILDESVIAGENIPVVPMYGERGFVEDEEYYEGITRLSKDPQRLRNFQMSYLADIVSRSPRPKPIFFNEQVQGFEHMYEENGSDNNYPYLLANRLSVNGEQLPLGPAGVMPEQTMPQALIASIQLSREAVEDVANAGLPQDIADPDLSGKAVYALQNRLDNQSMVYQQNMKHAKRRDGEIYASMATQVYDAPRRVTLTLPDGQRKTVEIMQQVMDSQTGDMVALNDLTNIEFEVFADVGPAYSTQKEQTRQDIINLLGMTPQGTPEYNMLLLKYLNMSDGIDMEDIREYANKQLILQGIKQPETDEEKAMLMQAQQAAAQQQQGDPAMMLAAQAEMVKAQAQDKEANNKAAQLKIEAEKVMLKGEEVRQSGEMNQMDMVKALAEIENIRAQAIKNMASADETSSKTISQRIANLRELTGASQQQASV